MTNDSDLPGFERKTKTAAGFTARYGVDKLVWYECGDDPTAAITREKALEKWRHAWKLVLIEKMNPDWAGLYDEICR